MREVRLGDDIDDFCVRCKRVMNHAVVSVINHEPAKVRCRTCHSDHDYRHEQPPPPKVDLRKQALFNEVLKKVNPEDAAAVAEVAEVVAIDDEVLAEVEIELPAEVEAEVDVEAEAEAEVEAPAPLKAPAAAAKAPAPAKAKAKGRARK
jgi:hypothetical protein